MKVHYDNEVDTLYLKLEDETPEGVIETSEGVNLDTTYDDGLDRSSSWPSSVVTADQDTYASWEIGAYVYTLRDVTLSVTTNENATCRYFEEENDPCTTVWASMTEMETTGTTSHSQVVSKACGANYEFCILCQDASENTSAYTSIDFSINAETAPSPTNRPPNATNRRRITP